jgi:hypothetical protein
MRRTTTVVSEDVEIAAPGGVDAGLDGRWLDEKLHTRLILALPDDPAVQQADALDVENEFLPLGDAPALDEEARAAQRDVANDAVDDAGALPQRCGMKQIEPLVPTTIGIILGCCLDGRLRCVPWSKGKTGAMIAAKPFPSG